MAKTLNFGLLYGMGVTSFAKASGFKRDEAKEFIAAYFKEFPEIRDWQERTKKEVRKLGFVKTLTGRRRYFPAIDSLSPQVAAEAERAAINQPLQGLAADIIKMAMIKSRAELLRKGFWGEKAKLLLSIHDELLFEVRDDMINTISALVEEAMESVFEMDVPLRAEASFGKDLGHLTKSKKLNDQSF
jgi:DNA polymerase-1